MSKGATRRGRRHSKHRWHPTRTSGRQKFLRALVWNEYARRIRRALDPIDMDGNDWSVR